MPEREWRLTGDSRVVAASHNVTARIGSEFAILNIKNGMYHGLDGVAARVWEIVSEGACVSEIQGILAREYDVDPGVLRRDLEALLRGLLDKGLIVVVEGPPLP